MSRRAPAAPTTAPEPPHLRLLDVNSIKVDLNGELVTDPTLSQAIVALALARDLLDEAAMFVNLPDGSRREVRGRDFVPEYLAHQLTTLTRVTLIDAASRIAQYKAGIAQRRERERLAAGR
jgi:hypothetical protein